MSKINDGGPAFPQPDLSGYGIGPRVGEDGFYEIAGMTIRDWFAGQMLPRIGTGWPNLENRDLLARQAYQMADAMLAARDKGRGE